MSNPTEGSTGGDEALNTNTSLPTVNPAQDEARIRALMSEKDKALAAKAQLQKKLLETENEASQRLADFKKLLEDSTSTAEQLLQQRQNWEQQQRDLSSEKERLSAENTKLRLLMQHPELLAYAEFIPAGGSEQDMLNRIENFKKAREADLQRNQPTQQASTSLRPAYPTNAYVPPPTVTPTNPEANVAASMESYKVKIADLKALEYGTKEYMRAAEEVKKMAESLARQQMGE